MERLIRLRMLVLVALGLLVLRLVHLQLIQGRRYRQLAEQNRLRLVPEPAPRGLILDRQGRILAASQNVFRVAVVPQELGDLRMVLAAVSGAVHRPAEALRKEYDKERTLSFMPATIVSRVPKDTAMLLEEARWRWPGLLVRAETVREYPLGSSAAHLVGYLSQPTAEEFPILKQYGVRPRELIGRMGIEQLLDHALRGRSGGLMVEVNSQGRQVRALTRRDPEPGSTVVLTIDAGLQSLIEGLFGDQPGACVVLHPKTGALLAMVSRPSFSPEPFALTEAAAVRALLNDSQTPLMNRAAVGMYQPGSIMKLITASAALEHRLITPSTTVTCPGALTIGDRTFHCWYRDGHGPMNLTEALMQSCNVYFMTVGRKVGAQRLLTAMKEIGLSQRTGWPLEEQPGHLPGRRLTEGEIGLLAIGQGEILVTPLQVAVMAAAFANRGWLVEPWMVASVGGRPVPHRSFFRRLGWSAQTIETVRQGMRAVVQDPSGTGHRAFSDTVSIAGKTGTAQTQLPGQTHGWFVGFCPIDEPQAAIAIVAEYGGSGGDLPAEIAKSICEYLALSETTEGKR